MLKELNPDTPIYGLGEDIEGIERLMDAGMEDLYVIEEKDSDWKWKNGDLAVRRWFKDKGRELSFEMLHIIEWDLLFTEPLDQLYSHVSEDQVGLTGLKPINEAKEYGWPWVNGEYEKEWKQLKDFVNSETGFSRSSYGCIFPGTCLPRVFLEKFTEMEVPDLCNDEVRVPLFAEAIGFELIDTEFFPEWGNQEVYSYFNAKGQEIKTDMILQELAKKDSRRTFHPVRKKIGIEKIREIRS